MILDYVLLLSQKHAWMNCLWDRSWVFLRLWVETVLKHHVWKYLSAPVCGFNCGTIHVRPYSAVQSAPFFTACSDSFLRNLILRPKKSILQEQKKLLRENQLWTALFQSFDVFQRWFLAVKIFVFSAAQRFLGNEKDVKLFWIRADQRWMSLRRQPG